jgi:protein ImuB
MGRRILSLWFPRLASERSLRERGAEGPFALVLRAGNRDHLHCLNPAAETRGLQRGLALADARAFCPDLVTRPADLAAEAGFLRALCRWMERYAPFVAREGADGLVADITGVAHLFGGEAALRADLTARLARAGLTVTAGIAGTRGAAHALARHGGGIAAAGAEGAALRPLPVSALRLDHETVEGLGRLGLKRIGDLMGLPRGPVARRFGQGVFLRLDQALGASAEPLSPDRAEPHFGVRMALPEPIGLLRDVEAGLLRLLVRLCAALARHETGARRLRLEMRRVDSSDAVVEIGLARPMRDPQRILALFRKGIDEVDSGFGIERLRLTAPLVEPLPPEQYGRPRPAGDEPLADLVTRLGNRLGFGRIRVFHPEDSHIPERSFSSRPFASLSAATAQPGAPWPVGPERPVTIFAPEPVFPAPEIAEGPVTPPARFVWRRMQMATARATGPERIAPEWWSDDPAWRGGLRDYWKVETRQGRRLWMFHTPQAPGWHVQGEFA